MNNDKPIDFQTAKSKKTKPIAQEVYEDIESEQVLAKSSQKGQEFDGGVLLTELNHLITEEDQDQQSGSEDDKSSQSRSNRSPDVAVIDSTPLQVSRPLRPPELPPIEVEEGSEPGMTEKLNFFAAIYSQTQTKVQNFFSKFKDEDKPKKPQEMPKLFSKKASLRNRLPEIKPKPLPKLKKFSDSRRFDSRKQLRKATASVYALQLNSLKRKRELDRMEEGDRTEDKKRSLNPLQERVVEPSHSVNDDADEECQIKLLEYDDCTFRAKIENDYSRSKLSSIEMDNYYDDFEHPPDLKICKLHGLSQRIGIRQPLKDAKEEDVAPSIVKSSVVYQHGLMFKAEVLSYLGTGYVLYFFFLKCLILVSGIISIMTLYIAYTYFMGSNCTLDNNCASNFILMFSIANYGLQANHEFRIFAAIMTLVITLINLWMISYARKVDRKADVAEDTPSDYTLMFTGFPKLDSEEEIIKVLNHLVTKWEKKRNAAQKFSSIFGFGGGFGTKRASIPTIKRPFRKKPRPNPSTSQNNNPGIPGSNLSKNPLLEKNKRNQVKPFATPQRGMPLPIPKQRNDKRSPSSSMREVLKNLRLGQNEDTDKIEKISKAYYLKDFSKITNAITELRKLRAKHRVKVEACKDAYQYEIAHQHMKKVLSIKRDIQKYKKMLKRFKKCLDTPNYSTEIAFVSFKYKKDRDMFLNDYRSTFFNTYICPGRGFIYKNKRIKVEQAPEPSDIIWKNLGVSTFKLLKRRTYTYVASILLLILSFIAVLLLKSYQMSLYNQAATVKEDIEQQGDLTETENIQSMAISFSISVVILAINQALNLTMLYFCELEKPNSVDEFNMSYMKKLVRLQFFNTCGVVTLSHMVMDFSGGQRIWQQGGLIYDAGMILLSKFLMLPIKSVLDPSILLKWLEKKDLEKDPKRSDLLQYEANELYTGVDFNLSGAFGDGLEVYNACMFFMPLIPLYSIFMLLSYSALYLSNKVMFARLYRRPPEIGSHIALESIYLIGRGPFILLGSILLNDFMFRRERGNSFAIYVTFAAFSFVLRMIIGRKLTMLNLKMDTLSLDGEFRDEEHFLKPYNKVRHSFDNEYDRANPVTAEEKTKEYLRWIFENGYLINNSVYEKMTVEMGLDYKDLKNLFNKKFSKRTPTPKQRSGTGLKKQKTKKNPFIDIKKLRKSRKNSTIKEAEEEKEYDEDEENSQDSSQKSEKSFVSVTSSSPEEIFGRINSLFSNSKLLSTKKKDEDTDSDSSLSDDSSESPDEEILQTEPQTTTGGEKVKNINVAPPIIEKSEESVSSSSSSESSYSYSDKGSRHYRFSYSSGKSEEMDDPVPSKRPSQELESGGSKMLPPHLQFGNYAVKERMGIIRTKRRNQVVKDILEIRRQLKMQKVVDSSEIQPGINFFAFKFKQKMLKSKKRKKVKTKELDDGDDEECSFSSSSESESTDQQFKLQSILEEEYEESSGSDGFESVESSPSPSFLRKNED